MEAVVAVLALLSVILLLWAFTGLVVSNLVRLPSRRLCIPIWGGLAVAVVVAGFQEGSGLGAEAAGDFVIFAALVFFAWAGVGLVSPRLVGLPSRWTSVVVWALSAALVGVGGNLLPDSMQEEPVQPRAAAGEVDREDRYQRWVDSRTPEQIERQRRAAVAAGNEGRLRAQQLSRSSRDVPRSVRDWLPRVRGGLGFPMQSILAQMPDDIQPTPSWVGKSRSFNVPV